MVIVLSDVGLLHGRIVAAGSPFNDSTVTQLRIRHIKVNLVLGLLKPN